MRCWSESMRCERFEMAGEPVAIAARLRALVPAPDSVRDAVASIIEAVRDGGDEAIERYTRQFDTAGADPLPLAVRSEELDAADAGLDGGIRAALELAIGNVRRVAQGALREGRGLRFGGHEVVLREAPLRRAAVYVPGGRAPYPSTVVMGVVTARVAGVREVAVCSPPGTNGNIDATVLAACRLTAASAVYRMGGAQAVAALAYGTESVPAADVIAGPGNLYVQEAKRQVFGVVGIDGFAGPSDLMVVADRDVDPELIVLDLLAQAEHGAGTLVVAVSDANDLLDELHRQLKDAPETGATAVVVSVEGSEASLGLAEAFAPEHLQLMGGRAEALAPDISRAGCVFVGTNSGTAFGDYIAGSNHVLPTNGAARFASALSPAHFRRSFTEVRIADGARELAMAAAPLARAEGFELHARSMEARIRDNGRG
jgi:histidinol dehydrogenase